MAIRASLRVLFSLALGLTAFCSEFLQAQGGGDVFRSESEKGNYTSWSKGWRLAAPGKGHFVFNAVATSDIHIGLSESPMTTDPMYEIVIGGWGNLKSVVRKKSQGPAIYETGKKVIKPGVATDYWVSVDKDQGLLSMGTGTEVGKNVFIRCQDPHFLDGVTYIALSSWETPIDYAVGQTTAVPVVEQNASGAFLRTVSSVYGREDKIVVEYSGFPEGSGAWINVVPKGSRDDEWGNYQYTKGSSGRLEFEFTWGLEPGAYEVRGYLSSSDQTVRARHTFTVQ